MGSRIINRIIPMRTFNYYRHGDEDINLLQACYENPLFDEDGTVLNDSRRKVPGQVDGIRTKGLEVNSVQTSVHYSPHDSSKWKALKVFAVIVAVLAIIGIIVGIIVGQRQSKYIFIYSKICVKRPLSKRPKIGFQDQLSFNAGQKYCKMLQGDHSTILSTFIKLQFAIKIFVLYIFELPFYTGFTVHAINNPQK